MFNIVECCFFIILLILLVTVYNKCTNKYFKSQKRLDGKTCVVTGGTLGMGLEIAKEFSRRGARVIVASPFEEEGIAAQATIVKETRNNNVEFRHLDLSSLASTRKFAQGILKTEDRLDILVNNAGIPAIMTTTKDNFNITMQVNYFGHFLLTILLLPLLRKTGTVNEKSRIVCTTSGIYRAGSVDTDNLNTKVSDLKVYANSKLYLLLFSLELSQRLERHNVVINTVDPGLVGTMTFSRRSGYFWGKIMEVFIQFTIKTPWQGAQTALHVALNEEVCNISGEYFYNCALRKAMTKAYDREAAKKVWDESIRLLKLNIFELNMSLEN